MAKAEPQRASSNAQNDERREASLLPWYVYSRTFVILWLLLALCIGGGIASMFARVPVYASGKGIVVDWRGDARRPLNDVVVVAFLPPDKLPFLKNGQPLLLRFDKASKRLSRPVEVFEREALSADVVQERFGFSPGIGLGLPSHAAVAVTRLEPLPNGEAAAAYVGRIGRVDMEVGSRRVGALIPVLGKLFQE